jgi:hypothetical protein
VIWGQETSEREGRKSRREGRRNEKMRLKERE